MFIKFNYVGTVVCMKRDAIIYSFMIKLTNKVSTELKIKIQVPIYCLSSQQWVGENMALRGFSPEWNFSSTSMIIIVGRLSAAWRCCSSYDSSATAAGNWPIVPWSSRFRREANLRDNTNIMKLRCDTKFKLFWSFQLKFKQKSSSKLHLLSCWILTSIITFLAGSQFTWQHQHHEVAMWYKVMTINYGVSSQIQELITIRGFVNQECCMISVLIITFLAGGQFTWQHQHHEVAMWYKVVTIMEFQAKFRN